MQVASSLLALSGCIQSVKKRFVADLLQVAETPCIRLVDKVLTINLHEVLTQFADCSRLVNIKAWFPFGLNSREYIKVIYMIEYVRRSTLNITNLNTA